MTPLLHVLADIGVVAGFALMAVVPGSRLVTWVFRRVDRDDVARRLPEGPERSGEGAADGAGGDTGANGAVATVVPESQQPATLEGAGSILRGGRWIGGLERLAVFASIAAGYPNGVAVSVAVKALARYPELKSTTSAAAERFIIGTFVSVLWACGWAGLARWVLTLF